MTRKSNVHNHVMYVGLTILEGALSNIYPRHNYIPQIVSSIMQSIIICHRNVIKEIEREINKCSKISTFANKTYPQGYQNIT